MRLLMSGILAFVLCATAIAAPPVKSTSPLKVEGDTIVIVRSFPVTVSLPMTPNTTWTWTYPSSVTATKKQNVLTVTAAPKGTHVIAVTVQTIDWDKKSITQDDFQTSITVGDIPTPTPPGPNPPGPTPTPTDIPFAGMEGLRVLIVEESGERMKLPPGQVSILLGMTVRNHLESTCAVGPDGKTKEYRIWDKDWVTTDEPKEWQAAMKRKRESVPWLIISNGKTAHEGPLPKTVSEMMELLKRF